MDAVVRNLDVQYCKYASHLHAAFQSPSSASAERALCSSTLIVNALMLGKAPAEVSQWLAGANLFALKKKDSSVRPVAAGDVTRRLVSKLCCLHCKEQASELLQPLQYWVGIKGGAEAVVHCTRAILAQNPAFSSLQPDFQNAFNEVERAPIWRK